MIKNDFFHMSRYLLINKTYEKRFNKCCWLHLQNN